MMNWIYKWHNPKVDPQADRLAETMSAIFLDGVTNGLVTPRPRPVALDRHAVQEATRAVG